MGGKSELVRSHGTTREFCRYGRLASSRSCSSVAATIGDCSVGAAKAIMRPGGSFMEPRRCGWAGSDPRMIAYHDQEWGVPVHDDRRLFEFLVLEGAQAGLSWQTILKKRPAYRGAFDNFDAATVAKYGVRKMGHLLADPGIVRNRLKLASAVVK